MYQPWSSDSSSCAIIKIRKCSHQGSNSSYPSSNLLRERIHKVVDAMLSHYRGVEDKLLVVIFFLFNVKCIGHQRVPVVQGVEFRCNAVLVLKALVEQQFWVKLELEVVAAKVLHVVFDHDLDGLSYRANDQVCEYSPLCLT